jgi:hypothetical protein
MAHEFDCNFEKKKTPNFSCVFLAKLSGEPRNSDDFAAEFCDLTRGIRQNFRRKTVGLLITLLRREGRLKFVRSDFLNKNANGNHVNQAGNDKQAGMTVSTVQISR